MPDCIVFGAEGDSARDRLRPVSRETAVDAQAAEDAVRQRLGPLYGRYEAINVLAFRAVLPVFTIAQADAILTALGAEKPADPALLKTGRTRLQAARDEANAAVV